MLFNIYSVGDPAYIKVVMLGLSHMYETSMPYTLGKIGLLISLLFIFAKSVWNPGKIEFKEFFTSLLFVYFMFCNTTTITLFSNNQTDVTPIPNIPLGIALSASITTRLGYELATSLRDFYQTAVLPGEYTSSTISSMLDDDPSTRNYSIVGNGLEPLRALMNMRITGDPTATTHYRASHGLVNAQSEPDLRQSLLNYMQDCVLKDEYNGSRVQEVNMAQARISNDAWKYMGMNYNGWTTSVNLVFGHGFEVMGCGDAYKKLNGAMEDAFNDTSKDYIETRNLKMDPNIKNAERGLAMITDQGVKAWQMKSNQMLKYMYYQAKIKNQYSDLSGRLASQAEFEAMDSRHFSSATQFTLWSEMAVPLMTYLEALIYLLGPIMPFVAAFGSKGIGMIAKYILLLVWVNTWPVLQVGVNLYLQTYLNEMTNKDTHIGVMSWAGVNTTFTDLQSFIAMGSTLQTMVPALSLMIMYGSVHTAINLANSASSGGGGEAAAVGSPKVASPANYGKSSSAGLTSSFNGVTNSTSLTHDDLNQPAQLGVKSYNMSNAATNASSDAVAGATQRLSSATRQMSTANQKMHGDVLSAMDTEAKGRDITSSMAASTASRATVGKAISNEFGLTRQQSSLMAMALHGDFGAEAKSEVAAALGGGFDFSNSQQPELDKDGKPVKDTGLKAKGGAKLSGAFGGAVGLKLTGGIRAALDSGLSKVAAARQSTSSNWQASHDKVMNSMSSDLSKISHNQQIGKTKAWGSSESNTKMASNAYSEAQSLVQTTQSMNNVANAIGSSLAFNFASALNDRSDFGSKVANGTMESNALNNAAAATLHQTGHDKELAQAVSAAGGQYDANTQAITGLSDDNKTKALQTALTNSGASPETVQSLKTAQQAATDLSQSGISGVNSKNMNERKNAEVRYAQRVFDGLDKNMLNGSLGAVFANYAKGNMLSELNAATGGGLKNLDEAANQFRDMGNGAAQGLMGDVGSRSGITNESLNEKKQAIGTPSSSPTDFAKPKDMGTGVNITANNTGGIRSQAIANDKAVDQDHQHQANDTAQGKAANKLSGNGDVVVDNVNNGMGDNDVKMAEAQKNIGKVYDFMGNMAMKAGDFVADDPKQSQGDQKILSKLNDPEALAAMKDPNRQTEVNDKIARGYGANATKEDKAEAARYVAMAKVISENPTAYTDSGNSSDVKAGAVLNNVADSASNVMNANKGQPNAEEINSAASERKENGVSSSRSSSTTPGFKGQAPSYLNGFKDYSPKDDAKSQQITVTNTAAADSGLDVTTRERFSDVVNKGGSFGFSSNTYGAENRSKEGSNALDNIIDSVSSNAERMFNTTGKGEQHNVENIGKYKEALQSVIDNPMASSEQKNNAQKGMAELVGAESELVKPTSTTLGDETVARDQNTAWKSMPLDNAIGRPESQVDNYRAGGVEREATKDTPMKVASFTDNNGNLSVPTGSFDAIMKSDGNKVQIGDDTFSIEGRHQGESSAAIALKSESGHMHTLIQKDGRPDAVSTINQDTKGHF
ncbi:conjugal transfer protein TraG N-terminal domain-containing protein [Photobacterium iliopiscarium]|uniref:conjugal transfer protein TraG N-terminal domain-containing protein n=1 Tax=Photobacterium iliopiscarium TaxID=56192 RepID=UPI001F8D707B|nr:conjugal transfer protein TraG N-terminal domain-containing protein [Photobacterium iliopiscarium]MCD9485927.1 hypothetical protein [Photobacterium iliopiscarium]MCF2242624.1 hypothetical protein [Photobacterium iliopiscarium]